MTTPYKITNVPIRETDAKNIVTVRLKVERERLAAKIPKATRTMQMTISFEVLTVRMKYLLMRPPTTLANERTMKR